MTKISAKGFAYHTKSRVRTVEKARIRADYINGTVEVMTTGIDGYLLGWSSRGEDVEHFLEAELYGMAAALVGDRAPDRVLSHALAAIAMCCREAYKEAKAIESEAARVEQ